MRLQKENEALDEYVLIMSTKVPFSGNAYTMNKLCRLQSPIAAKALSIYEMGGDGVKPCSKTNYQF